jgi:hypothetical protein
LMLQVSREGEWLVFRYITKGEYKRVLNDV